MKIGNAGVVSRKQVYTRDTHLAGWEYIYAVTSDYIYKLNTSDLSIVAQRGIGPPILAAVSYGDYLYLITERMGILTGYCIYKYNKSDLSYTGVNKTLENISYTALAVDKRGNYSKLFAAYNDTRDREYGKLAKLNIDTLATEATSTWEYGTTVYGLDMYYDDMLDLGRVYMIGISGSENQYIKAYDVADLSLKTTSAVATYQDVNKLYRTQHDELSSYKFIFQCSSGTTGAAYAVSPASTLNSTTQTNILSVGGAGICGEIGGGGGVYYMIINQESTARYMAITSTLQTSNGYSQQYDDHFNDIIKDNYYIYYGGEAGIVYKGQGFVEISKSEELPYAIDFILKE